jgi:DNA polymerase/3'-5' exonuclease PolX
MELKLAQDIAVSLCKKLQPFCDKINIAGSVRRQKIVVKDIEIICIPKKDIVLVKPDMFSEPIEKNVIMPEFAKTVLGLGKIIKGKPDGKYMQIELPELINLDLFIPDDFDYYRQYAIRTGSADYTARYIAAGWKRIGWCGSDKGLRKISDCIEHKTPDNKSRWICQSEFAEKPPIWESEEQFFEWLGIKWVHPKNRNITI